MSVFLIGGGWSDAHTRAMYGGFGAAASARSATPRVTAIMMGVDQESREYHERFLPVLAAVGLTDVRIERVAEGEPCPETALDDVDAVFVGGGPTPEYHASLAPLYPRIRALVDDGVPYAGFSAGAAIAATEAIVGGWLLDGVPICPEDSSEEREELQVVEGIGLLPGAVEVHAAQWGNLARLVAAVDARRVSSGIALDECTTLAAGSGADGEVSGAGRVWRVGAGDHGTVVRR